MKRITVPLISAWQGAVDFHKLRTIVLNEMSNAFGVDKGLLEGTALNNTIEISIDVNTQNFVYASPFAKVVTGVDMSITDGRGVEGLFLPRVTHNESNALGAVGSTFKHIDPVVLGVPVLVGFKYGYGTGKHAATSRFAQLFTVSDKKIEVDSNIVKSVLTGGLTDNIVVSGNLSFVSQACDGMFAVDNFKPARNAYSDIFLDVDLSQYKPAMDQYMRTHKEASNKSWTQTGNPPPATAEDLVKYGEKSLFYNGKRFKLPEGTVVHKMEGSDIYLVVYIDEKGHKQVSTLDALANYANELDENMIEFMEDQAKQLEAIAYAYRVVAAAARKDN